MKRKSPGMPRYLFESIFHQTVQRAQETTGKVITVSAARALRSKLDEHLAAEGVSMSDPNLGISPVLRSIEATMSEGVVGYEPVFVEKSPQDPAYREMSNRFTDMVGFTHKADGEVVQPEIGPLGPRLPISPYDPRWAVRSTVKAAGSSVLYVADHDVETLAGGEVDRLDSVKGPELALYRPSQDETSLVEAGDALTIDDVSGMTELMGRMSPREYNAVRSHVIAAGRLPSGQLDFNRYMSTEALGRATAILDELRAQGVGYQIKPDRYDGQIKAEIDGTRISVRLTEPREQEAFVGRVYDDGVSTYYSTNQKVPGSQRTQAYVPSARESVDLMRFAQGQPVLRSDGEGYVGERGTHKEGAWSRSGGQNLRRVMVDVPDAYFTGDKSSMNLVGDLLGEDGRAVAEGAKFFIRRSAAARSPQSAWFGAPEKGEEFLEEAVTSARANLTVALDLDGLFEEFQEHAEAAEAGEHFFETSGDVEVAAIQRAYWDVLRGAQTTLLRPGATEDEYNDKVGVIGELTMDDDSRKATHDMLVAELAYTGTPEQKVRDHAKDLLDEMIGTYEPREVTAVGGERRVQRFNPAQVSERMTSEFGQWRNQADLVAALRITEVEGDHLVGEGFYTRTIKDRLVKFDPATAEEPGQVQDPFVESMMVVAMETLERNGCEVLDMSVDANGIIHYEAERVKRSGAALPVAGEIGQIFAPGERGEVITNFASGDNYMFVPGYEARILAQKAGEDLSVEERTRLRGYAEVMADKIRYQLTSDLMSTRSELGDRTSLNGVYSHLTETRYDEDFATRTHDEGLSPEWVDAILETSRRRVRYPSALASESTVHAAWREENSLDSDPANDNFGGLWALTGFRNMAIMTEASDGYFDPDMTNGAVYQGITRYMVEGAEVDEDGRIVPGESDDRAPLMKMPETQTMKFDPYDRRQMTAQNLLNASGVTDEVGVAFMTFGGWTSDDPMVVSKRFAHEYGIRADDGTIRPLVPGDKLSDLHGNKGVISLIVDPEMDMLDAMEQDLEQPVQIFRENPDLDVVMSPFSAVSRFNGGSARDLMREPSDMVLPHKGVAPSTMGRAPFIVTHKDADSGTRVYDDEAIAQGRGRKASSQLAWALGAQGCDKVMAEFYGPNNAAAANFREFLVTMGLDMAQDGTLQVGYDDSAPGAERRLFEMQELVYTADNDRLNTGRMRADFGDLIGDRGGDLELPFSLNMPSGRLTEQASETSWKLPVMSAHLRSGQDLEDGVSSTHDYTNQYLAIYEASCRYRHATEQLERDDISADARKKFEGTIADAPHRAQASFDIITEDLKQRRFTGKRNIFKEGLMASRLPNSATAVWTSDPRLDIDQIAMGPAMAEAMGLRADDHALIWRDPVLRDSGVRYMRVAIDDRLTGVAINPVMAAPLDGDFDGDSIAIVKFNSEGAKRQAHALLSVEANLLDLGRREVNPETGIELHPLAMQNALDTKVSQHLSPELKDRFEGLALRANMIHSDFVEGAASVRAQVMADDPSLTESMARSMHPDMTRAEMLAESREVLAELSEYYRDAQSWQYGDAILRFGDAGDHVQSVIEACVDTGAKGSPEKVEDYCRYLGVDPETFEDLGLPQQTREEDEGVQLAVAVKTHGTGTAGMFSQRGVKALRNSVLKPVLELTYPVTQSILQSKHDPAEAKLKYELLMGPARDLWRGRKIEAKFNAEGGRTWEGVRDDRGNPVQATQAEWEAQFVELYTASDGLNVDVNVDYVAAVATALKDPSTERMVDIDDLDGDLSSEMGSTMDRLAYGGDFSQLLNLASLGHNVFDGEQNGHFAPYAVRRAQQELGNWQVDRSVWEEGGPVALEAHYEATLSREDFAAWRRAQPGERDYEVGPEAPHLEGLAKRDVLVDSDAHARVKGAGRRLEAARTVRAPSPPRPQLSDYETEATEADAGPSL